MRVVVSIAGSDSGGGAGIQADIKTFEYFGCFGMSVLTVLTAQNTLGVSGIYEVTPDFVESQFRAVEDDFEIGAVKIGMLFSKEIIECVGELIARLKCPIVLDPVAVSNAGSKLLKNDAIDALKRLFKTATVITPNRYELELFMGEAICAGYIYKNCFDIVKKLGCAVVAKNYEDEGMSTDFLLQTSGLSKYQTRKLDTKNTHGTGCTFSSALASNLALGKSLEKSVEIAKNYVHEAITHAPNIGHGGGPIKHNLMA